jgi:hypothetical protein
VFINNGLVGRSWEAKKIVFFLNMTLEKLPYNLLFTQF